MGGDGGFGVGVVGGGVRDCYYYVWLDEVVDLVEG